MNLRYANASLQAWCWQRELTGATGDITSSAQAGIRALQRPGTLSVIECIAFRELFNGWPELTLQHDASEFWEHLQVHLQLPAIAGQWQARLSNPFGIVDSGPLAGPVLLTHMHASLQQMIHTWQRQYAVHGLIRPGPCVCLQLCRYTARAGKDMTAMQLEPGATVPAALSCRE